MSLLKIPSGLVKKFKCLENNFHPALRKSLKQLSFSIKAPKTSLSRVLSIDDNKICQKVNTLYLEELGCLVESVSTARDALEKLVLPYKIIFLDVNLPDCSNDVLVSLIRNDERNVNKNTPIVIMGSWFNEPLKKNYLAMGVNEVYTKPIAPLSFKKILQTYKIIRPLA